MIETNGHKPYAYGVLLHPLVLSITGVSEPSTGLQSKFSWKHSAVVAYVDGNAGIPQYSDEKVVEPGIGAICRKVTAVGDAALGKDEAFAVMRVGERTLRVHVPHASGTSANPMTDEAMRRKFVANAVVLPPAAAEAIVGTTERFEESVTGRLMVACARFGNP